MFPVFIYLYIFYYINRDSAVGVGNAEDAVASSYSNFWENLG